MNMDGLERMGYSLFAEKDLCKFLYAGLLWGKRDGEHK